MSKPENVKCPKCGGAMVSKLAKKGPNAGGRFWGCGNFPTCRGTRNSDGDAPRGTAERTEPAEPEVRESLPSERQAQNDTRRPWFDRD